MRKLAFFVSLGMLVLIGCSKGESQAVVTTSIEQAQPALTVPSRTSYTIDDWKRNFSQAFEALDIKTDEDGITEYYACFEPREEKPKCRLLLSGKRDGFIKGELLTPIMSKIHVSAMEYNTNGSEVYVGMHVAAPQCKTAGVVLNPKIFAKTWLFMDKVAFMSDGNVVYEKSVDTQDVKRDVVDDGIQESWVFSVNESDYEKLAKFAESKSQIIRVSGEKGYMTLSKTSVQLFSSDIITTMAATAEINKSLIDGGGPECSK